MKESLESTLKVATYEGPVTVGTVIQLARGNSFCVRIYNGTGFLKRKDAPQDLKPGDQFVYRIAAIPSLDKRIIEFIRYATQEDIRNYRMNTPEKTACRF
jgi:hypothetical protein